MWSFVLKTLRNIHGRWTSIRRLLVASDYAKCGSLDQTLEVSVEGVRSCSHGKSVFYSTSCRNCCGTTERLTEIVKCLG